MGRPRIPKSEARGKFISTRVSTGEYREISDAILTAGEKLGAQCTAILSRFQLDLPASYELSIRQMPTLSPRDGMPMIVRRRASHAADVQAQLV